MTRLGILAILLAAASTPAATLSSAQTATPNSVVRDNLSLPSTILNGERKYAVYLPPGYETSTRHYPVLYLLHGKGDDHTAWIQFGEVQHIADEAIRSGKATPMIIVMPNGNDGHVGFFNNISGNWNYEDFFFDEFIPFIETEYRIKSEKRYRAIAGLSMGGGGSFVYALHRPDMFSSAAPLSASFKETREIVMKYYNIDPNIDPDTFEAWYQRNNVLALLDSVSVEDASTVRWYLDCGDDDFLFDVNALAHIKMRRRNIRHEYRVRDGSHTWSYWRESLPEVLAFATSAFHK